MKTLLGFLTLLPLSVMAGRVLVLLEPGFNGDEFYAPAAVLRASGHRVDVASSCKSYVPLRKDLAPSPGRDVKVDLAIAEVEPSTYDALFIPGGYSPASLEKDPEAVRVVKAFLDAGKPMAMICHGPRILLSHDLLDQRAFTCLHKVADEIPEIWQSRPGRYLDRPLVLDRNLLTSRFPLDAPLFAWNMLVLFGSTENQAPIARTGSVALVVSPDPDAQQNRHFVGRLGSALSSYGARLRQAAALDAAGHEKLIAEPCEVLALDIQPADWPQVPATVRAMALTAPRLVAGTSMREWLHERALPVQWVEERGIDAWTRALVEALPAAAEHPAPGDARVPAPTTPPEIRFTSDPSEARAVLALRDGYDDEACAAWFQVLHACGREPVLLAAAEAGDVRGVNNGRLHAGRAFGDLTPSPDVWVIAPGFFAPKADGDAEREDWLLAARTAGATLFLTGLDTLGIGSRPAFKGKTFTGSEQSVWSFPKEGARYRNAPIVRSDERLFTLRGAYDVPALPQFLSSPVP